MMRRIIITDHERKVDRYEIEAGHRVYVASRINERVRRIRQLFPVEIPKVPAADPAETAPLPISPSCSNNKHLDVDAAMAELPGRLQSLKKRIQPHGNDAE